MYRPKSRAIVKHPIVYQSKYSMTSSSTMETSELGCRQRCPLHLEQQRAINWRCKVRYGTYSVQQTDNEVPCSLCQVLALAETRESLQSFSAVPQPCTSYDLFHCHQRFSLNCDHFISAAAMSRPCLLLFVDIYSSIVISHTEAQPENRQAECFISVSQQHHRILASSFSCSQVSCESLESCLDTL